MASALAKRGVDGPLTAKSQCGKSKGAAIRVRARPFEPCGHWALAMKKHVLYIPGRPPPPLPLHEHYLGLSSVARASVSTLAKSRGDEFGWMDDTLDAKGLKASLALSLEHESADGEPGWLAKEKSRLAKMLAETEQPEAILAIEADHRKLHFALAHGMEFEELGPLHEWAIDGDVEAILAAARCGADLDAIDGRASLMHLAAKDGNAQMIRALASAGARIDPLDGWGMTPLHCAAQLDNEQALAALLSHGADASLRCDAGMTPLMWAASSGSAECADLLSPVSDLDAVHRDGKRAADFASKRWPALAARLKAEAMARRERSSIAEHLPSPGPSRANAKGL